MSWRPRNVVRRARASVRFRSVSRRAVAAALGVRRLHNRRVIPMRSLPIAGMGLSLADVETRAAELYVYGYPLILMDLIRRVATATAAPSASKAPINQFLHARAFPDPTSDAIRPELDTLASTAWLDLSKEPIVLSVPCLGRRYYVMQLCDAWTNVFASPGSRTTGTAERDFVIVGPHAKGTLPRSVTPLRAPTNMVWLLGRTQTKGPAECGFVNGIQERYALTPLSAIGGVPRQAAGPVLAEAVDVHTSPRLQVERTPPLAFFRRLATLMIPNPPADVDSTALARFAPLRIIAWKPREPVVDVKDVPPRIAKALEEGARIGHARIVDAAATSRELVVNHWRVSTNLGRYGTDYLWRAVTAMNTPGASLPEDAIHFHTSEDAAGRPLTGANRYVLSFPPQQLPPVHACWSVTMYDARQRLVEGRIRHRLGTRDEWAVDPDGSLPIYLHHESPGIGKPSNWLPAPAEAFTLTLRLHWPHKDALDGNWTPPPVTAVV
jgi:hypothetical protein